jgi:hypothetical protein
MPITQPLLLTKNFTTGNETFTKQKALPDGAVYLSNSATAANPESLTIRHSTQNVNGIGNVDTHLVQVKRRVTCADGVRRDIVINVTMRIPQDAAFTNNLVEDVAGYAANMLIVDNERNSLILGFT